MLLRLASPERVVARLPRILSQYFDFGRIEGAFSAPKTYEAKAIGLPRPLALWMTSIAHGFVPVVMEKAGARDVQVRIKPFQDPEVEHGITLVTAAFEVTWR